jgi:hypothetical protein
MITGLRRGEQLQLTWNDVYEMEVEESRTRTIELIKITVSGEKSKVGNTRKFVVKDYGYFLGLLMLQARRIDAKAKEHDSDKEFLELSDDFSESAQNSDFS